MRKISTQKTVNFSDKTYREVWEGKGIPPPRKANVTWYHNLSVQQLWEEISHPDNGNIALVTIKRSELNRGYFNGQVLISEKEKTKSLEDLLKIPGVIVWEGMEKT